jgi:putative copper export protein
MDFHALLRLVHITGFAAWFGTIFATLFLLKTLEPGLTGDKQQAEEYSMLLRRFIKLETKVADVAVISVILSGLLLAQFYQGWTPWVFAKIGLLVLQIALTMGFIVKAIQPIAYPCDTTRYRAWYRLFAISFSMFAVVLLVTFFLR